MFKSNSFFDPHEPQGPRNAMDIIIARLGMVVRMVTSIFLFVEMLFIVLALLRLMPWYLPIIIGAVFAVALGILAGVKRYLENQFTGFKNHP